MIFNKQSVVDKQEKLHSKGNHRISFSFVTTAYVMIGIFLFFLVIGVGAVYGSIEGIIASAPSTENLAPKSSMTTIYDSSKKEIQKLYDYTSNREIVSSEEIPDNLRNAFIAIEDERFYEHNGVDVKGIARAIWSAISSGGARQGASTITQQLIKNNKFSVGGESNFGAKLKRKIQEQWLAIEVEKKQSKEEILRDYLNSINLGKGTLGVQTASQYYFKKSAKNLTLAECAVLASITKNPNNNNPVDGPENNRDRQQLVLKKMYELNFISNEDYQKALAEDVYAKVAKNTKNVTQKNNVYSYFTDAVILQVVKDLQNKCGYTQSQAYNRVYRGGLNIYSTQDTVLQNIANKIVNDEDNYPEGTKLSLEYSLDVTHADGSENHYSTEDVKEYYKTKNKDKDYTTFYSSKKTLMKDAKHFTSVKASEKNGDVYHETIHYSLQPQLSYTLIDQKTGHVKVLIGGRGEKQDDLALNRATGSPRQPGSTFKILSTYAPGIDSGSMTLGTTFYDAPYKYKNGTAVHNYSASHYVGMMTVRDAIAASDNIVAVKALTKITPQVGYDYLLKLGFSTLVKDRTNTKGENETDVHQALALGGVTDGVTNLELTGAYATIANGGKYNKPVLYTKITDSEGNVILENEQKSERVMKATTAWLLTDAMKDVVTRGTGKDAQLNSDMAVCGKTGTTSNNFDYWFSGYTPYYTASIWTGYDYQRSFDNDSNYHKKIWAKIMDAVIDEKNQKEKDFDKVKGIKSAVICRKSGQLAHEGLCEYDPEGDMVRTEYFTASTVPKKTCTTHVAVEICTKSGLGIGKYCPHSTRARRVYRIRPKGASNKTDDADYYLPAGLKGSVCNYHTYAWYQSWLVWLQKQKEEQERQQQLLQQQQQQQLQQQQQQLQQQQQHRYY